ncbi:MAG: hypothetical protein ACT4QG_20805 [Sporichthyaceae bacterium]
MGQARIRASALVAGVAVACSPLGAVHADAAQPGQVQVDLHLVRVALERAVQIAALVDSATVTSPVILHGTAAETGGIPMAGAEVLLSAWPANETVLATPDGSGTFATVPIARTAADENGRWTLRAALTPASAALIGRDGLDLQLEVVHGGRSYTHLTQVVPGGALGWLRTSVTKVDLATLISGAPRNAVDLVFAAGAGNKLSVAASKEWPQGPEGEGSDAGPRPWMGGATCVERKVATKKVWTTVASAVAQYGSTANVTYKRGAETEMDAAVSYDGPVRFIGGGKRTRSSTLTAPFDPQPGTKDGPSNREFKVLMAVGVFAHECLGNNSNEFRIRGYRLSPLGTSGGFNDFPSSYEVEPCPAPRTYRTDPVGGEEIRTEAARAFTYERGFGVNFRGASFGGASTSGYSDTVEVRFTYAKRTSGRENWWCGHTKYPGAAGQRVQGFQR